MTPTFMFYANICGIDDICCIELPCDATINDLKKYIATTFYNNYNTLFIDINGLGAHNDSVKLCETAIIPNELSIGVYKQECRYFKIELPYHPKIKMYPTQDGNSGTPTLTPEDVWFGNECSHIYVDNNFEGVRRIYESDYNDIMCALRLLVQRCGEYYHNQ